MADELERVWKEAFVAYGKYYSRICWPEENDVYGLGFQAITCPFRV
jgi:hypothetical protein